MLKLEHLRREVSKYDYVRFSLCDLNCTSRGQVIPSRYAARYIQDGLDMFEGILAMGPKTEKVVITHEKNHNLGNMLILSDPYTLRPIPWAPEGIKMAEILCESRWKKDNSPQLACPRYVTRMQLQRLDDLGLDFYSGNEIEFKLLDESLNPVYFGRGGFNQRLFNKNSKLLFHFDRNFQESNIDVESYHAENTDGIFEAVTKPKFGIESPDMAFNLKEGLMEMADLQGFKVTFMANFNSGEDVIANHFNFSLWNKSGENVFYDDEAPDKLSTIARQWIAGILKHGKAICAFANPTVNCYRNFFKMLYPLHIYWGIEDRHAYLRIKNKAPCTTYIENRLPSGKSNPYLVMASTIAAGLDGVNRKMECPAQGKTKDTESFPCCLAEALAELEKDVDLCHALGYELVTWFVKSKKDAEIAKYDGIESDEERFAIEKENYL
ncbi:lengsin-like [Haliotis asinina]|uniref:lengsin-like n=1 Tax=Haliotis asinina TaxID=109174 RepID=UPI0035320AA1